MMTHQLEVSILAAPLGAIDRRALSQAWYSALGMASQSAKPRAVPTAASARAHPLAARRENAAPSLRRNSEILRPPAIRTKRIASAPGRESATPLHRSAGRGRLAERIERAFSASGGNPKRATFSLGRGSARVHVILQTSAGRTTLLAICRPELRNVVARALSQARIALAARGVEFCAIGAVACS